MKTDAPNRPGENAGDIGGREIDRLEEEAARLLAFIDQESEAETPAPEKNNLARPLVSDLRFSLVYTPGDDVIETLERQALALDNAFRRLLSNADITFENSERCDFSFPQYAAALRAQEQFCRTARAITHLKDFRKRKKQKLKRGGQTEGIEK